MTHNTTAVFGICPSAKAAEAAVRSLEECGLSDVRVRSLPARRSGSSRGVAAALARCGIDPHQARRYELHLGAGAVLLSVRCGTADEIARARTTLTRWGAADIVSVADRRRPAATVAAPVPAAMPAI